MLALSQETAHTKPNPPIAASGRIDVASIKAQIERVRRTSGRRRPVVAVAAVAERTTAVVAGEQEVGDGTSTSIFPEGVSTLIISTFEICAVSREQPVEVATLPVSQRCSAIMLTGSG